MKNVKAHPMSRNDITTAANYFRGILDLSDDEYFPIVEFIEWVLPQIQPDFILEIETHETMAGCYGLTYPSQHRMIIREDVYQKAIEGIPRDRFTLSHELGHYVLHKENKVALARTNEIIPAYADPEWQANAFAADILIPMNGINDLTIDEIVKQYRVSRQAAEIQWKRVNGKKEQF